MISLYNACLILYALCNIAKAFKKGSRLFELLGFKLPAIIPAKKKRLWLHAVSVGEVKAAAPLIEKLRDYDLVVSTTTETGQKIAKALYPKASAHFLLPLDFSWTMRKLINRIQPSVLVLSESDLWFNLLTECKRTGARCILVNGKMSERSLNRFRLIPFFTSRLLSQLDQLCVQNKLYASRFKELGVPEDKISITGNLKFDMRPKSLTKEELSTLKARLGIQGQPVITFGSTHRGEEKLFLPVIEQLLTTIPRIKIFLCPRHPDRAEEIKQLLSQHQLTFSLYSDLRTAKEKIILVDQMGALKPCIELSDIAIIAGSYERGIGGHNILEPLYFATPVIFGPHMDAQQELCDLVLGKKAGIQIDHSSLYQTITELLADSKRQKEYIQKGKELLKELSGSSDKTLKSIKSFVKKEIS